MAAKPAAEVMVAVETVLVVDDQPDAREAMRLLLKGAGYSIETAASPGDALAAAASRHHDLIILDMNYARDTTSGQEGLHLLDRLRALRRNVPLIAVTGWSTIELAVEAMHRGASDFITKPWDNSHLLSIIRKHLNGESVESRPLDAELAVARKVQRRLLPAPCFDTHGLQGECACLPAGDISGDLYDFFPVDSGSMAVMLGDVSGSGIGAALLVANLQGTIRGQRELASEPARLMHRVNDLFYRSTRPEHFATLVFAAYEARTRILRYVNCGHPAPVLLRGDGSYDLLPATATVLGAFESRDFEQRSVQLAPGDRLVFYSDGFSEAADSEDPDLWAVETIRQLAAGHSHGLAGKLVSLARAIREQPDDITVMYVRAS
jgi:sigma-B regulation protein RsbU (phosphoserine phosphatase)